MFELLNNIQNFVNTCNNDEKQLLLDKIQNLIYINNEDEPLLNSENNRFTVFPILRNDIWKLYKSHVDVFWKVEDIDFSHDYEDFMSLNKDEQIFIKRILA